MNYQLIKLPEGNIVISDENILSLDWVYYKEGSVHKVSGYNSENWLNNCKKLIASDFHSELPSIDYNGLEESFGIVDVERLADDWSINPENVHPVDSYVAKKSYLEGFNKTQSLNDKKFSLDDIKKAISIAKDSVGVDNDGESCYSNKSTEQIIQSLQQPKVFDIEGVLENNVFKITKVL